MNLKLRGIQTRSNIHFTCWVECFWGVDTYCISSSNLTLIDVTNFDIFVNLYMILYKKKNPVKLQWRNVLIVNDANSCIHVYYHKIFDWAPMSSKSCVSCSPLSISRSKHWAELFKWAARRSNTKWWSVNGK